MQQQDPKHPDFLSPDFVTRRVAARLLALSEQTLSNMAWRNQGPPYVRLSARCVRYKVDDLLAWAKGREIRPEAE
jgi:hypothetical protein